jgi:hypothetical protein
MAHLGQITAYTNTAPHKRVITDRIILASPYKIQTILALGLDNESKFNFVNTPGKKYEWLEDAYLADSDTVSSGLASSSTTTTFTPTTPKLYQPGDVLLIDSEYIWVSANSGTVLTVVRDFGGTQATHANASTIKIAYSARLEGVDADDSPSTTVTTGYNYSTILQMTVEVSRTDQLIQQYGMSGTKEYYIDKNMDELMQRLNKLPYYGQRAEGSATEARSAGGFETFMSTNATNLSSAALTRKNVDDLIEDIYGYGGSPKLCFCNTWVRRKLNEFYEGFVRTERDERMGGIRIETLEHPFGGEPIKIITDRNCPAAKMYFVDTDYAGFISLDEFFYEDLAKTGDAEKGQTVGEYGFVMAFEKAHGYIYGISTSA